MKITIEGNTVDGSARSTLNVVLSGARGPQGEPSPLGVPYTGATQDVNLGEFGLLTGNVEFDTTPTNTPTGAGSMYYDDTSGTVVNILKGGNVISKIGETQHVRVYNNTGSNIAKGKVVAINGAQGQRPTIILADADSETLSKDTIGFTAEAINDGSEGFVMIAGVLTNVSTSGMTDGDTLYLSTTAGSYTNVKPEAPVHMVILGFVVNGGSGGAGQIYVKVDNGYELEELHNLKETPKTTAVDADALLLKDSADSNLWKPFSWLNAKAGIKAHMDTFKGVAGGYASLDGSGKIPSTELPSYVDDVVEAASFAALPVTGETGKIYVTLDDNKCYRWTGSVYIQVAQGIDTLTTTGTSGAATLVGSTLNIPQYQSVLTNPVTGTGTSGQVAYWSGTTTQTGSSSFVYDAVNQRVGVGTNAPKNLLHISDGNNVNNTISDNAAYLFLSRQSVAIGIYGSVASSVNLLHRTVFSGIRSRGTLDVPLAVSSSDSILSMLSGAYDGFKIQYSGEIRFDSEANATADNAPQLISFITGTTGANRTSKMQVRSDGRVLIGNTDGTGRLHVRGSGTTSSTTALLVQNSTPSALMQITDNGTTTLTGTTTTSVANLVLANSTSSLWAFRNNGQISQVSSNQSFNLYPQSQGTLGTLATSGDLSLVVSNTRAAGGTLPNGVLFLTKSNTDTNTSGITRYLYLNHISTNAFAPTSGTGQFILTELAGTINQTGGANGITRGLYVNPTLTSAADWRGIESVAASNANHTLLKLRNATVDVFTVKSDSTIGFFNATPVAQPTTAIAEANFVENSGGTAVNVDSTFAGYTIQQIAQALKDIGLLA